MKGIVECKRICVAFKISVAIVIVELLVCKVLTRCPFIPFVHLFARLFACLQTKLIVYARFARVR